MKRLCLLILASFLFWGCKQDNFIVTNSGEYQNISYNGYNSSLTNIELLNTENGCAELTLLEGEEAFENIIFDFDKNTTYESVFIKFNDLFAGKAENYIIKIITHNQYTDSWGQIHKINENYLFNSTTDEYLSFNEGQTFELNYHFDKFVLSFSLKDSYYEKKIKIQNVVFN